MLRKPYQQESADLVRIERVRNMARFYSVALWPDLFGGVTLARKWGRIGRPGQLRLDAYSDPTVAEAALDKLVRQKQRKGYQEAGA